MCVARSQTVEDAEPLRWPAMSLHHEDTTQEFVRYELRVRCPESCGDFDQKLVIRLYQMSTSVTCTLERLRIE